jgi:hypothetical protein
MSTQRVTVSDPRAASAAPSLSEFFDEVRSADAAQASADYDFFGDSHFTAAHD